MSIGTVADGHTLIELMVLLDDADDSDPYEPDTYNGDNNIQLGDRL